MEKRSKLRWLLVSMTLTAAVGMQACDEDVTPTLSSIDAGGNSDAAVVLVDAAADAAATSVALSFRAVDGQGTEVTCGRSDLRVAGLTDARLGDLRLYVSRVALKKGGRRVPLALDQDGTWQAGETALLDFENKSAECQLAIFGKATTAETNRVVRGRAAEPGPYDGVEFEVGVPKDSNYLPLATAPSPLNLSGMDHGTDGRQFIRFAFYSVSTAVGDGGVGDGGVMFQGAHNLIMLRSVCDAQTADGGFPADAGACAKSNRAAVSLTGDPSRTILFDVSRLLQAYPIPGSANIGNAKLSAQGRIDCFGPLHAGNLGPTSGADRCGTFYPSLGLDYSTGAASGLQNVFRVE